jgi:hypothetical protein
MNSFPPDGLQSKEPEPSPFQPSQIADIGGDTTSLFDTARNIYLTLNRAWPEHDFSLSCDTCPHLITVYVAPVGLDVINEDYFAWMASQLRGESTDSEGPGFVTADTAALLDAVHRTLRNHKFIRLDEDFELNHEYHFFYTGPFIDRSMIASYIETASQKAGIPLEWLRRFRDEHPKKLRHDTTCYVDGFGLGVLDW